MKMITVEVTTLVEDDVTGLDVQTNVTAALECLDGYNDQAFVGYEWYNAEFTSERPYATEEES